MSVDETGRSCVHFAHWPMEVFQYLTQQQHFLIDLTQKDSFGRTPVQAAMEFSWYADYSTIRLMLGDGPISSKTTTEVWQVTEWWTGYQGPTTFLHEAVARLRALFSLSGPCNKHLAFISELIIAGANLHARNGRNATALDYLLSGEDFHHEYCYRHVEYLLLVWLRCLIDCGVDLHQYFHKEEEFREGGRLIETYSHRRGIDRRLVVYYGLSRDDVTILVEDERRESDTIHLPGSWDAELEFAESQGVALLEGREPKAFLSITTSGFQFGDYSVERASCVEEISYWDCREAKRLRQLWETGLHDEDEVSDSDASYSGDETDDEND
jgi:hypothetical protein